MSEDENSSVTVNAEPILITDKSTHLNESEFANSMTSSDELNDFNNEISTKDHQQCPSYPDEISHSEPSSPAKGHMVNNFVSKVRCPSPPSGAFNFYIIFSV